MRSGWFPKQHSHETDTIRIQPLSEFEDSLRAAHESGHIYDDWFNVPIQAADESSRESCPPIPMPWFALSAHT
jgi:hypothetical protein